MLLMQLLISACKEEHPGKRIILFSQGADIMTLQSHVHQCERFYLDTHSDSLTILQPHDMGQGAILHKR